MLSYSKGLLSFHLRLIVNMVVRYIKDVLITIVMPVGPTAAECLVPVVVRTHALRQRANAIAVPVTLSAISILSARIRLVRGTPPINLYIRILLRVPKRR